MLRRKYGCVDYVNGRGLVGAILFKDRTIAEKVVEAMVFNGVMPVHTWSQSIKIGPPLTITEPALEEAFDVIENILREVDNT